MRGYGKRLARWGSQVKIGAKPRGDADGDANYEVLRLKWQECWVDCTLPHESAMVSKTRSCLTAGLT
jgi:hypothetical protein